MLPIYLLGNLHCLGMCGPLVAMLGQHRFRYCYFLGRIVSFTLVATIAAEAGAILNEYLHKIHLSALLSIGLGTAILWIGWKTVRAQPFLPGKWTERLKPIHRHLSLLILKDHPIAVFLFGFFTVALPCGQTFLVFSTCALSADLWTGFINGLAFAILTSPSLFFALRLHKFLGKFKHRYPLLLGIFSLAVGLLALCRGLAEMHFIPHWIISHDLHLVMY